MVRVITQETFDSVVRENMEEFEMGKEDAIKEAKEQFESQGIDLSNVVQSLEEDLEIVKALKSLETSKLTDDLETIVKNCDILSFECKKGMAEKVLCSNNKGYEILVELAKTSNDQEKIQASSIRALASLLDKNPDDFDVEGFAIMVVGLDPSKEPEVIQATLDMILSCCVLHELNRQNLIKNGLLEKLDAVHEKNEIQVSRIWQALVQDDDVRVPHGKAHEHARSIVEDHDGLSKITTSIKKNFESPSNLKLLLSCLSSLSVRNEYCQVVAKEHDGLKCILDLLVDSIKQTKGVVAEALKLLKTLAGNDNVKKEIAESNGIYIVISAMNNHMSSALICHEGCMAITAICLRATENAKQVVEAGGAQLLTQILKIHHSSSARIAIACCSAIRNIVSRSKHFASDFVELEIEELLNSVRKTHPQSDEFVKAALRDLGLKVEMKEQWKGTGVAMNNDPTATIKDFDLPEGL